MTSATSSSSGSSLDDHRGRGRLSWQPATSSTTRCPAWAQRFLAQLDHHLGIAYVDGSPAGFVSGVEVTHPDKGTEMFLYELVVDAQFQRRGIGNALVRALADQARERGCYGMWVLTEAANPAALATYISSGANDRRDYVMLTWRCQDLSPLAFCDLEDGVPVRNVSRSAIWLGFS